VSGVHIDMWTGVSPGVRDPDDPEVVETTWAIKDGAEILSAEVVGGGLLHLRVRLPDDVYARSVVDGG